MKSARVFTILILSILSLVCLFQTSFSQKTAGEMFEKALYLEEAKGELQQALDMYLRILKDFPGGRDTGAKSQLHIGLCYEKLGLKEAKRAYQRVIADYPDQKSEVTQARNRLAALRGYAGDVKAMTARQIWAGSGVDVLGSPSPDGRYLSFVDWETGDLALREIATGEMRRLTKKGEWFQSQEFAFVSVFSPDGNQIAYSWHNDEKWELRVIRVDGSSVRVLYSNDDVPEVLVFDWSGDGKYIAATFAKRDGARQIALVSPADSSVRIVKSLGTRSIAKMCFSPDGRYLAYDCPPQDTSRQRDIYVVSIDDSREISVVRHPADDVLLGWAPSGKTIFFGSNRTGAMDGWTLNIEGGRPVGDPKLIKRDIGRIMPMGFSQNGSFYYGGNAGMSDIYGVAIDSSGRVLSPPAKITERFVGSNFCPAWSSDGKYLAYRSQRQRVPVPMGLGWSMLCILTMQTGSERDLLLNLDNMSAPSWSADGRSIFLHGNDSRRAHRTIPDGCSDGRCDALPCTPRYGAAGIYFRWTCILLQAVGGRP